MPYVVPNQPNPNADFVRELTKDLLLAALTKGMSLVGKVATTPTPQNQGNLQFPSGLQTRTSPGELAQIQALGGVPTRQGSTIPFQPGGVTYNQPTRLGIQPDLSRQLQQAQLAQTQAQTRSLTPEFQAELIRRAQGLSPNGASGSPFQQIEDDALAGDEDAVAAYRYLKKVGAL